MNSPFLPMNFALEEVAMLESELRAGLDLFWQNAAQVLDGGSIMLVPPGLEEFSIARNFFSSLFLYSYYRVGVPSDRRILYAAVNQCLRGMVTGCDNILDNEYKKTLETDLPRQAHRFRSVLDIMVADRVLFALLAKYCEGSGLPVKTALRASAASLQALTESGAQEASEEGGVDQMLAPETILKTVHHYKTGLLFKCTWAVPTLLEPEIDHAALAVQEALYQIGIGCQILDDIVDLAVDVKDRRHNYAASVLAYREGPEVWRQVKNELKNIPEGQGWDAVFPELAASIKKEAVDILGQGLGNLFRKEHHGFIQPAIMFVADRIGVALTSAQVSDC